jgi:ribosomal protein S18 acetylase RimI-like enzyme
MALIRAATADDVDAMAAVWLRSALTAYAGIFPEDAPKPTHEQLVEVLTGGDCLVAIGGDGVGGGVVGLVQAEDGWLSHLYVDPDHWGRRIGTALHDAAVERLRADGGGGVARLWVLRENKLARAMYERRGWTLTDEVRPVYAPAGVDDVQYRLDL